MKSLSALLRWITSKHDRDFYCLNCFHSYSTKNKLEKHEKVCNDHDYCYVDNKKSKYNYREKSMRDLFIIYAELECLLEKMNACHNNLEKSSTDKINMHKLSGYSLYTNCSFYSTNNKLDC